MSGIRAAEIFWADIDMRAHEFTGTMLGITSTGHETADYSNIRFNDTLTLNRRQEDLLGCLPLHSKAKDYASRLGQLKTPYQTDLCKIAAPYTTSFHTS